MNSLAILAVSIAVLYLGYRFYAAYIEKVFGVKDSDKTPSVEINDGIDYVPTKKFVLFGHHFASIAGGGPIIGPTVAFVFGFLPVWLWILIGTVFVGAVHDFTSLMASMREKGRSISEIAEKTFGRTGFLLFIGFTTIMLLMVTSVFLTLTVTALSSKYPVSFFGNTGTAIQTVIENGITYAVIGGVASTSVIIITAFSPFIGYLLYKRGAGVLPVSILAVAVTIVSIQIGIYHPVKIDPFIWMIILSFYTLFAAGVPVWLVLQPRDFTNSFLLYGGIITLLAGGIVMGFSGEVINAPMMNLKQGNESIGYVWPLLFITVACGACSGFHALVAGGTTSKQISTYKDAKYISYGGMILESLLAVTVLITIGIGLQYDQFLNIVFPASADIKSNPILAFALAMGSLLNKSFGLDMIYGTVFGIIMVEGFVVTTLDTAVRLNRYLFEELWRMLFKKVPKIINSYLFNALLSVVLMFVLSYFNAFKQLWALFGTANQLLSGLTLVTVSVWLLKKGKKYIFAFIPGIFMFITSIASLVILLVDVYIPKKSYMMAAGDIILLCLSLGVFYLVLKNMRNKTA